MQICECCFESEAEQFLQEEGMWVCNECLEGILKGNLVKIEKEIQGIEVDVMPKEKMNKDKRVTVRLASYQVDMLDYLRASYVGLKLEMTDSEILRLALNELATKRGYKVE